MRALNRRLWVLRLNNLSIYQTMYKLGSNHFRFHTPPLCYVNKSVFIRCNHCYCLSFKRAVCKCYALSLKVRNSVARVCCSQSYGYHPS